MRSFNALLLRDVQLATRVGGSARMGARVVVIVVTQIPVAIGAVLYRRASRC